MNSRLQNWNRFTAACISLVLLILALNPFKFHWFVAVHGWSFDFWAVDFFQNVFLFFPLGVVLRHSFQFPQIVIVLYGALLSSAIEIAQLSIIERSSNFYDILANACGTLCGSLFYQYAVSEKQPGSIGISLAFMLMPLCWVTAMRSATQDISAWLVMPPAIAGIVAFEMSLSANRLKLVALTIWLIFALIPLINITPIAGIATFIIVPAIVWILPYFSISKPSFILGLLGIGIFLILTVNIIWYVNKSSVSWTVSAHLHWIETLMSGICLAAGRAWAKSSDRAENNYRAL
ncbi:MAG: VanZ family protein [Oscillatoriaceae cyanobacterium Prado104]|jgi:glycopeptide antibiotics resistance protein|nr:VanZ family protein [Oscillatoriaceae cyanobacterium Prado104]